jgi:hypothetical protein
MRDEGVTLCMHAFWNERRGESLDVDNIDGVGRAIRMDFNLVI